MVLIWLRPRVPSPQPQSRKPDTSPAIRSPQTRNPSVRPPQRSEAGKKKCPAAKIGLALGRRRWIGRPMVAPERCSLCHDPLNDISFMVLRAGLQIHIRLQTPYQTALSMGPRTWHVFTGAERVSRGLAGSSRLVGTSCQSSMAIVPPLDAPHCCQSVRACQAWFVFPDKIIGCCVQE